MKTLDGVRLMMLNFSFSNRDLVPECVPWKERESVKKFVARKTAQKGQQLLEPIPEVLCLKFLPDLVGRNNFELVDAFARDMERNDAEFTNVQFIFAAEQFVEHSEEFLEV